MSDRPRKSSTAAQSSASVSEQIRKIEERYDARLKEAGIERFGFIPVDDTRSLQFHEAWNEYREDYDRIIATLPKPPPVPPGWEGALPDKAIETLDDLIVIVESDLEQVQRWGRSGDLTHVFISLSAQSLLNAHRWLLWKNVRERPFPKRPTTADDAERELADLLVWLELYRKRMPGESRTLHGPAAAIIGTRPTVMVDLEKLRVTISGAAKGTSKMFDIRSSLAARWLKILADNPGRWISSSELKQYDDELDGVRTDRLRKNLPPKVRELIESSRNKGSRLRVP